VLQLSNDSNLKNFAFDFTPACASKSFKRTPFHIALPIKSPPTGFEMQESVRISPTAGIALTSSSDSANDLSTSPAIDNFQSFGIDGVAPAEVT